MRNYVVITEKLQKKKKPKTPPTKQSTTNPLKSSRYATWQLLGPRGLNVQFGLFPCFLRKHQQAQDHCKWPKRVHLFLLWIRLDHQKFQFSVTDLLTLKNAAFKKKPTKSLFVTLSLVSANFNIRCKKKSKML